MTPLDAMEPKGDWPGVEAPAIDVGNEGDDAAELLSISDALIGGEEPSGDGFGGELLELRRAKLSREGSDLGFCDEGVLTLPFLLAVDKLFDFGASRRCFFTGDLVGARVFLDFSRELSLSRSEVTEEAVDKAFVIAVVVCRRGGDTAFFSSTFGGDSLTSSISMSSSESSTLSADFTLELTTDSLRFALLVFAAADFGGLPIGPLGFAAVAFAVVGFLPFLPMIRDIASFCVGFPVLAVGCEADRAIGSPPPLAFLVTCMDDLKGSTLSAVTVMLGGGAGFDGSLAGCGGAGFGSTLPLSPGARIICHSGASLDRRSRLKAARVFVIA